VGASGSREWRSHAALAASGGGWRRDAARDRELGRRRGGVAWVSRGERRVGKRRGVGSASEDGRPATEDWGTASEEGLSAAGVEGSGVLMLPALDLDASGE
jgi:hypothetical protein